MSVHIKLSPSFKKYTGGIDRFNLDDATGKPLAEVLVSLGLPENETGLAVINGRRVGSSDILQDGDQVNVYPYIIGG